MGHPAKSVKALHHILYKYSIFYIQFYEEGGNVPPISVDDDFQPVNVHRSVSTTKLSQQQIGYQRATGVATFTTQTPHTYMIV